MSAAIFVRLMEFSNIHVIVLDRKDPFSLRNYNNEVYRQFNKYCKKYEYRDNFYGKEFGDSKRNVKINFMFKNWVIEDLTGDPLLQDIDVVIHCGHIYDTLYSAFNKNETINVNVNGTFNLLKSLPYIGNRTKNPLVIHCSSINVYGDLEQTVNDKGISSIDEDGLIQPNPKDVLNMSLLNAETMVKSMSGTYDYIILRLGTLSGAFTPISSLVNAAVAAVLKEEKEFTVYNGENSIEFLDIDDFANLIKDILNLYITDKHSEIVNQVYNIKSEEPQPKTVVQIVRTIFGMISHLPQVDPKEYPYKGLKSVYRLSAPRIKEAGISDSEAPIVRFGEASISAEKAKEKLKFISSKPLVYSLVPNTVNYQLNYIHGDISELKLQLFTKIFYLHKVPTPENVDPWINKDVKNGIQNITVDIHETVGKMLDNEEEKNKEHEYVNEDNKTNEQRKHEEEVKKKIADGEGI